MRIFAGIVISAVLLVGCGGNPTQNDINDLNKNLDEGAAAGCQYDKAMYIQTGDPAWKTRYLNNC